MISSVVVSVLVAAAAWFTWTTARLRTAYDLHKIPGPAAWPVRGNLDQIAGSSYLHRVSFPFDQRVLRTVWIVVAPRLALQFYLQQKRMVR